ncbi:MAG: flagellar protein FlgN [Hydrogenophilaceae bacterium]|nr:flagellar protein FlgN [Hydrogenophilaceae bacterium]
MSALHPWQPETELSLWKQLVATLIQEQVVLRDGNIDTLTDLAAHKRNLVVALAPHIKTRGRLLIDNGLPSTDQGMESLIQQSQERQAGPVWREIRETERMARDLNQINGRLINLRMGSVEQALNVLSGAAGGQKLYNPGGQATYRMHSRAISV